MEECKYYVYEWIRLDTNEPFYVGKGCGDRWKEINGRNSHFTNIVKTIPCAVNILHDNLDEQTAFGLEVWYIKEYREIIGYNLVNVQDGGEGHSAFGKNNSFYGKQHTKETRAIISSIRIERGVAKGENNPNYGKRGELSPIKGRQHSQEELNKMIENSPLRVSVKCIELNRIFLSLTQVEKIMKEEYGIKIARRQLAKRLNGEIKTYWYGEIEINGELVKLHWEYC